MSNLKSRIKKFPQNSGVYVFYGGNKKILYVGKATNLRNRVSSYFTPLPSPLDKGGKRGVRPIEMMIHEVADIKTIETDSVLEALILESNLIKKYQPKYNVKEKDDKSFSYFIITKEEWPRVLITRKTDLNVIASEDANDNLHRSAAISLQQSAKHNIKIRELKNEIATVVRGGLPRNDNTSKAAKIYGPYTSKKQMEIALKIMRRIFSFHSAKQKTEKGCLDFQIGTCPGPYAGAISKQDYQKNIRGIKMILEGKMKNLIRGLEKEMGELARKHEFEKAGEVRNKIFALKHIRDVALISNGDENFQFPRLPKPGTGGQANPNLQTPGSRAGLATGQVNSKNQKPKTKNLRIEAYDISNISGQYATGSMVVFRNGEPDKSQYRKFKIKTIQGADDVGMMREVLLRRFNNDWPLPDLILLDGGQGHVNMGQGILRELGLAISVVAIAKGKTRKNLKIQIPKSKQNPNPKIQNAVDSFLQNKKLVKQIMDEAHRFAIGYHRKLRNKHSLR